MVRTHISCVIDAPVHKVWQTIRPFDALPAWHPHVASCVVAEQQPADRVGCIRRIKQHEGGTVVETLLALSDLEHRIVYDIVESPMPVRNYIASLALHEITEGSKTFAIWSVEFDTPDDQRERMIATLQDVFRSGLLKLNELLNEKR
jgi:hypothetical protein